MDESINILDYTANVFGVLGPGNRFILWTQGCPFSCKNCTTPEGIPIVPNKLITVRSLVNLILKQDKLDGITISGGEPFLQASKLLQLVKGVKQNHSNIDVIVYSGFQYSKLNWSEAKEFLNYIDLLIDGLYVDRLNDNKGIRGSTNQKFQYLTDRLIPYKNQIEKTDRNYDYIVNEDFCSTIGIPQNLKYE